MLLSFLYICSEEVVEGIGNPLSLPPSYPPWICSRYWILSWAVTPARKKLAEIISQCVR